MTRQYARFDIAHQPGSDTYIVKLHYKPGSDYWQVVGQYETKKEAEQWIIRLANAAASYAHGYRPHYVYRVYAESPVGEKWYRVRVGLTKTAWRKETELNQYADVRLYSKSGAKNAVNYLIRKAEPGWTIGFIHHDEDKAPFSFSGELVK